MPNILEPDCMLTNLEVDIIIAALLYYRDNSYFPPSGAKLLGQTHWGNEIAADIGDPEAITQDDIDDLIMEKLTLDSFAFVHVRRTILDTNELSSEALT